MCHQNAPGFEIISSIPAFNDIKIATKERIFLNSKIENLAKENHAQDTVKLTFSRKSDEESNDSHISEEECKEDYISNHEETKDDNYLLEEHPYEIKFIMNKETNRKLKRMVCKFDNCNKVFEKKWNFKDHIRMHRGDTPYQCKI